MREVGTALVSISVQSLDVVMRAEIVREVLGARPWIPLPGARNEVPGVVVWGGRAVSLVDLARFYQGLARLEDGEARARMLIATDAGCTLAVPADRVSEVWKTHDDNLRSRHLSDFELAQFEVAGSDGVLPLFEPRLLLARLGIEV